MLPTSAASRAAGRAAEALTKIRSETTATEVLSLLRCCLPPRRPRPPSFPECPSLLVAEPPVSQRRLVRSHPHAVPRLENIFFLKTCCSQTRVLQNQGDMWDICHPSRIRGGGVARILQKKKIPVQLTFDVGICKLLDQCPV